MYVITTPKGFGYLGRISLLNYLAKKKMGQKLRNIAGNNPAFHAASQIFFTIARPNPCNMAPQNN